MCLCYFVLLSVQNIVGYQHYNIFRGNAACLGGFLVLFLLCFDFGYWKFVGVKCCLDYFLYHTWVHFPLHFHRVQVAQDEEQDHPSQDYAITPIKGFAQGHRRATFFVRIVLTVRSLIADSRISFGHEESFISGAVKEIFRVKDEPREAPPSPICVCELCDAAIILHLRPLICKCVVCPLNFYLPLVTGIRRHA